MLIPCLDPRFATHLNAFYAEAIGAVRAWFIGLNAQTTVLLAFTAAVIVIICAISIDLTRRNMRAPGWISPDVDDSDGPRATEANSVVIALAILLVGMSDMWAR